MVEGTGMTDFELLLKHRQGSPEAFGLIVRRHIDWVWSVARRRVRDAHLAEDVTQATFIVLAQKKPVLKSGQSLSAWLFKVVSYVSLRAIKSEQRRRRRELEAAKMQSQTDNTSEIPKWDELATELDDLVARLRQTDRQPLLMRFYEQKSFEEVAAELHLSEDAARKRVWRAVEKLREMFSNRGMTMPSAALGGVLMAQATATAPPALAATTISLTPAALGTGSSVAILAKGAINMMTWAKAITGAAVAAAIMIVAGGAVLVSMAMAQQNQPAAAAAATPTTNVAQVQPPQPAVAIAPDPTGEEIRVKGRVLDPTGKPVAGARITVSPPPNWNDRLNIKPAAQVTTGPDGRYVISYRKSDVAPFVLGGGQPGGDRWRTTMIVASADGWGTAWNRWNRIDSAGDVVIQLVPDDAPIEGRILTPQGRPAFGVKIVVDAITAMMSDTERQAIYAKDPDDLGLLSLSLPLQATGHTDLILTDADGRFRITGLGKDRVAYVQISGPTIGYRRFEVATRLMEPQVRVVPQPIGTTPKFITYGAKFEYTAVAGTTVQGTVTDAATGQPMAGVRVESYRFAGEFQGMDPQGLIQCITDAQGQYSLEGFPRGTGNQVMAVPNDDQPYFIRQLDVPDQPGTGPAMVDFELHRGVWITGKVTDKITGQPVPARIQYTTYINNTNTHNLPEFKRERGAGFIEGYQSRYENRPDGTYRIVGVPGPAIVWAWCLLDRYRTGAGSENIEALKEQGGDVISRIYQPLPSPKIATAIAQVEVSAGAASATADLVLDPGQNIHINIVDPDGTPVARRVFVRGESAERYIGWHGRFIDSGSFDAACFAPGDTRTIIVLDEQRKLGKVVWYTHTDPPKDLTIKLEPLMEVTGRCVDAEGKPVVDLPLDAQVYDKSIPSTQTDADGKYRLSLIPGGDYGILVTRGPYLGSSIARSFTPVPGGKRDLGETRVRARRQN